MTRGKMKSQELIKKYKEFYERIRNLMKDEKIFPAMNESDFEEFVSQEDWMGIPSFHLKKSDITASDKAHISIRLGENKIIPDVFFNGTKAVNRFLNILHSVSIEEKENFIDTIRKLDERYYITLRYAEKKNFAEVPKWKKEKEIKCKDLDNKNVEELLKVIRAVKEKRDLRQKQMSRHEVATLSVSLAKIELNSDAPDEKLREVFLNLTKLIRIAHNIKSNPQIKKIEKNREKDIEELRRRKFLYEQGLGDESQDEYERIREALGEYKKNGE